MTLSILNETTISLTYAFDFDQKDWEEYFIKNKLPKFYGRQVYQWIYQKINIDPLTYSNLPLAVRNRLKQDFSWHLPKVVSDLSSQDGSQKFLLQTKDDLLIEMVLMPYENRSTLCLSSQVGCKMGCTFCQTGKMGFSRNLTSGEILCQILLANHILQGANPTDRVTNVVFMGMGEPLDNYDEVVKACKVMLDEQALGLSKNRVTISTSGLIPQLEKLGLDLPVRLAISLHSANNEKRSEMMPINRKYSLDELKKVLLTYPAPSRFGITFEYVMIEGVNDSIQDAKQLVRFLHGLKAKVNLIPINHFPGIEMNPSSALRIREFQSYLSERSIPAPVRYSRGQDVSGGCGQLAAKAKEELNMDPRELHKERRKIKKFNITNN